MHQTSENYLWDRISVAGISGVSVRKIIKDMLEQKMIQSAKQAWRTLEKWERQGKYEYGVSLDLGWRTGRSVKG